MCIVNQKALWHNNRNESETGGEERMKKQAVNPYLPSYEYVPDGEPRMFGERLYIFGSMTDSMGRPFA